MYRVSTASLVALAVACRAEPPPPVPEVAEIDAARKVVSRLDYIAADYPPTVEGGEVVDQGEYDEQLRVLAEIRELAPEGVARVEALVRDRAPGEQVASVAREIADGVLARRDLVLAPLAVPDRDRARALFRENCVKCHGPEGAGDGPQRDELKIKPRNLTAPEVAETLSMRRVFNTLTDGMPEAEMPSFDLLSVDDRWSLAAFALTLRFVGPDGGAAGAAPVAPPGPLALANRTNAELEASLGEPGLAYVRTVQTFAPPAGPLSPIAEAVAAAVVKHREGKLPEAGDHLDAAIAEVFAPLRPALAARERTLAWQLEAALYDLRAALDEAAGPELVQRAHRVRALIEPAEAELSELAPIAVAGMAGLAALGWIAVVILCGAAAARASDVRRVGRAIHIGWVIAAIAGTATLLFSAESLTLESASQRHQLVAALRLVGAVAGAVAAVALARRLAVPIQRQPDDERTPWWLATVVFAIGYGGALEAAAEIGRIAAATGASEIVLLLAAAVVIAALAALLRLLGETRRRIGDAPVLAIAALAALVSAIALAGQAARSLHDTGSVASPPATGLRFDPIALYPSSITTGAQLAIAAIAAAGIVFLLISRRGAAAG